jgi:DNA-binding MarR family transcriptional regulator
MYLGEVSSPPPPDPQRELEQLSASLVTYAARLGRAVSRRTASDYPAATMRLLSQIDEVGPVGISSLAEADRCTQPTMSGAVQKLVDKGWATKTPHPADARAAIVALTDAGRSVLAEARRRNGRLVAERLGEATADTRAQLQGAVDLLQRLLAADARPAATGAPATPRTPATPLAPAPAPAPAPEETR